MKRQLFTILATLAITALNAEMVVDVTGAGAEKISVSLDVGNGAYAKTLKRNLELSGVFTVRAEGAAIKVSGTPGASVQATGRGKTAVQSGVAAGDDKAARMAARAFADKMTETFAGQKGFAQDKICFINRKGSDNADVCVCYPDGQDIRQVTGDSKAAVGPRWKNTDSIFYTGYRNGGPSIWEVNTATGDRKLVWSFKGLTTGAVMSPDGTKVAIISSMRGNPDLYVIDLATKRYKQLTNTKSASEGQPAWSPDGRQIVYVSDETRHPQLYVIDVATASKRRITSKGNQNVDPDWGKDGKITYISKRGGSFVAVIDPKVGESSVQLVTDAGTWEHPSWARDARHIVAGRDKALFLIDTAEGGDKPRQLFSAKGNWITPSWSK